MKILHILFILCCSTILYSQSFELYGGLFRNSFYDTSEKRPNHRGVYSTDQSGYFGIGLNQIQFSDFELSVTLSYEQYEGQLSASSGGLGGGRSVRTEVNKSILSLTVIPIQYNIKGLFDVSLGFMFSSLLQESFSGEESVWAGSAPVSEDLNEKYDSFSQSFGFGIKGIISRDFKISNKLTLCPHYAFGIGLINEFINFPRSTKSMRHYWGIGLKRGINQ